jgi:hypothetical protein
MSDTKEVSVSLSEADVKAFSRGGTRRGRKPRAAADTEPTLGGGANVVKDMADAAAPVGSSGTLTAAAAPALPPVPAAQLLTVVPAAASVAAPAPAPVTSSTAVVGGGVKLQAKKVSGGAKAPSTAYTANTLPAATVTTTAKIIPTKKHISTAPAARTLKKPRLVVGGASPAVTTHTPQNETNAQKGGVLPQQQKRRRRFTERRISIELKSAKATRRHRRKVRSNIAIMPITKVRDTLIAKGVLKPKADGKLPPDDMMRSMLKDYMLLHAAE